MAKTHNVKAIESKSCKNDQGHFVGIITLREISFGGKKGMKRDKAYGCIFDEDPGVVIGEELELSNSELSDFEPYRDVTPTEDE